MTHDKDRTGRNLAEEAAKIFNKGIDTALNTSGVQEGDRPRNHSTPPSLSLQEAKDQVAKTIYGHPNWETFRSDGMDWRVYEDAHDEVAEVLARSQVNEAHNNAVEKCINAINKTATPNGIAMFLIEELKKLKR